MHPLAHIADMISEGRSLEPEETTTPDDDTTSGLTADEVEQRYRKLAMQRHPDRDGGSSDAMAELSWARDKAREHFGI